jgi:hypothetical protein
LKIQSMHIHPRAADAAAVFVAMNALVLRVPAATALPALKPNHPNHPNHSRPVPSSVNGRLCGDIGVPGYPRRRPMTTAATIADTPELTCTTVPPAKSSAPKLCSHPPAPHTQWAMTS